MASQTPPSLTPDDLAALGLHRNPFAEQADLGFVFADAAHKTQLNVALQLLQASDRVLLVRGERGIGKTAFLHGLAHRRTSGLKFSCIAGAAGWTFDILLGRFLSEAELVRSHEQLSVHLAATRLAEAARAGERAVLLLDDAETLDDAVLARLLSLRAGGFAETAAFGLVMAVGPDFDARLERLKQEALGPEQLHVINLYPYSEQQSADYLTQRLALAGDNAGVNLTETQKRDIHTLAKGVPAALNAEANLLLAERAAEHGGRATPAAGKGRRLYLLVATVVLLLTGVLVAAVLTVGRESAPAPVASVDAPTARPYGVKLPTRYSFDKEEAAPAGSSLTAERSVTPPPTVVATRAPGTASATPAESAEDDTLVAPLADAPVTESAQAAQARPEVAAAATPSALAAKPAPEPSGAPANSGSSQLQWVRTRDPERYTVQLIAAYDRPMLARYLKTNPLSSQSALLATERKGKDWYVVVQGDYPDATTAKAAIAKLPAKLRDAGPFVRRFGSLQATLR